jgi:TolB-like protein
MRIAKCFGLLGLTGAALACATLVSAQPAPRKDHIAVLDFDAAGASTEQVRALTNQLRADLLKTGRFVVVDRSQINQILDEQAFQQSGCTSEECAVQVGRILGIEKIISGTVTKVSADFWQVSAILVEVETAETLRAETLNHRGSFPDLLIAGMPRLAERLTRAPAARAKLAPAPPAAPPEPPDPLAGWRAKWISTLALGLAAGYYGYAEGLALSDSNERQKDLVAAMNGTGSSADYNRLRRQLRSEEDAAQTHQQNTVLGYAATAVFLGLAAWIYFDPPEAPEAKAAWLPVILPEADGWRLAVLARW